MRGLISFPATMTGGKGKPGGWQQVKNEGDYLESLQLPNVELLPKNAARDR